EIGPAPVLLGMGKRCLPESKSAWLPSLRQNQDEWQVILDSLGKLYVQGADVDWNGFDSGYSRNKVSLPNYPFDRQRYWLEPSNVEMSRPMKVKEISQPEGLSLSSRSNGKPKEKIDSRKNEKPKVSSLNTDLDHAKLLALEPAQRQKTLEDFLQRQ